MMASLRQYAWSITSRGRSQGGIVQINIRDFRVLMKLSYLEVRTNRKACVLQPSDDNRKGL
jgi:hypothetical protein